MTLPVLQVDPDITQDFDSTSLPLSSPFLGESGSYQVYGIGDDTGNYTVSYIPLVRGNYSVTVKKPALWEIQVVQTVVEATGEDLSGELWCSLGFDGKPSGNSSGPFLPIPGTEWAGRFVLLTLDLSILKGQNFTALYLVVVPGSQIYYSSICIYVLEVHIYVGVSGFSAFRHGVTTRPGCERDML